MGHPETAPRPKPTPSAKDRSVHYGLIRRGAACGANCGTQVQLATTEHRRTTVKMLVETPEAP